MKQIYVGNLPPDFTNKDLYELFAEFGRIESVLIAEDPKTGIQRDFGFLEMYDDDAVRAIKELNGKNVKGSKLRVEESKPKLPS